MSVCMRAYVYTCVCILSMRLCGIYVYYNILIRDFLYIFYIFSYIYIYIYIYMHGIIGVKEINIANDK
jgi:hypothetical protein